jgi:hypothetical protein
MKRRRNTIESKTLILQNAETKHQQLFLPRLIIVLTVTLVILIWTDAESSGTESANIQSKQIEGLTTKTPTEQTLLETESRTIDIQTLEVKSENVTLFSLLSDGPFDPNRHDSTSLLRHIWYRGEKFDGKTRPTLINTTISLSIDSLSISSESSFVTLQGQVKSWGSHHGIRYFFGATEQDDAEPTCPLDLSPDDMKKISEYCSGRAWKRGNPKIKFLRNRFARGDYMERFRKTPGWMCAQKRYSHALGKIGRFYRREWKKENSTSLSFLLPDYLLLQDEDTYYNMVQMYSYLERKEPSKATADAGCLIRLPVAEINFDYPQGGFGFILSRAALEQWIRPIECPNTPNLSINEDKWEAKVCAQLKENLIGENFVWKNGMSITDLMDAYAGHSPYTKHMGWRSPGYCIHGDWSWGYFINYYAITEQSTSFSRANERTRIEQTLGYNYGKPERNCKNEGQAKCTPDSHVCHGLHGVSMNFVVRLEKQAYPQDFRTVMKGKKGHK